MTKSHTESLSGPADSGSPWALASLLIGLLLAMGAMAWISRAPKTNFADAALAEGAVAIFVKRDQKPIHISTYEEVPEWLEGIKERDKPQLVLWLGNSQLHAVNQASKESEPASAKLHDQVAADGIDLVAASYPNANLQEHYTTLAFMLPRLDRLEAVVLPVVFDDVRETSVRENLLPLLQDEQASQELASTEIGARLVNLVGENQSEEEQTDADMAGLRNTFQEQTETFLNDFLERNWSLWEARKQARGKVFLKLYELRNYVFNITPQSKRRLIKPLYEANMAALKSALDLANQYQTKVLLYVVPLRTDVETPYVDSEYNNFKQELEALCQEYPEVTFKNFEQIVPAELWGVKSSTSISGSQELDFMHFQEPGHELLADHVGEALTEVLNQRVEPSEGVTE